MMENQSKQIGWMPSKAFILTFFLLAHAILLIMMFFTFPVINEQLRTTAFDLKTFGYTESEVITMLENLDESTVQFYLFPQLFLLDLLYPALLAILLWALIIRLYRLSSLQPGPVYSILKILPFVAMSCDYLENIWIARMITSTTSISAEVIKTASVFTQLKGTITMISWMSILILYGIWLYQKGRKKITPPRPVQKKIKFY